MSRDRSRSPENDGIFSSGTNLYISNLSYNTREQDLHEKFAQFGKIKYCKVVKDPYTNESRGFGFVTFESVEDSDEAVKHLNSTDLDGRQIRIELAKRSRAYSPTPGKYLGNPKFRRSPRRGLGRSHRDFSPYRRRSRTPPRRSPRRSSPRRSPHRYR